MIIGRSKEQKQLEKAYKSKEAEFIVIYGRRRVGKTFLIREYFAKNDCILFHVTGLQKGSLKEQLNRFSGTLSETFFDGTPLEPLKNWDDAFNILHKQIIKLNKKTVVFLDELPWLATRKSNLLHEIDYYWNQYWSKLPHIILVVCGSSASWLIKKIIYNKGGLHNRTTCQIKLAPFSLSETKKYLTSRKIKLTDSHILALYMALGGIPYYLKYVEPGFTAQQNIQHIIFDNNAPLENEFKKLFDSLFENSDAYIELIKLIAKTKQGIRRTELQTLAKLSTGGGRLSKRLTDLCETGFIEEHTPWGRDKGECYKLIDEFCLFYLNWVYSQKTKKFTQDHWISQSQKPSYYAWAGYAFEAVCMKHIEEIIRALKIKSSSSISSWHFVPRKKIDAGAQIDLLIDRNDNAITLCEIKCTEQPLNIDKPLAEKLKRKIAIFKKVTGTKKQIFLAIISANGMQQTIYSEDMVDGLVTLNDLFDEE